MTETDVSPSASLSLGLSLQREEALSAHARQLSTIIQLVSSSLQLVQKKGDQLILKQNRREPDDSYDSKNNRGDEANNQRNTDSGWAAQLSRPPVSRIVRVLFHFSEVGVKSVSAHQKLQQYKRIRFGRSCGTHAVGEEITHATHDIARMHTQINDAL